MNCIKKNQFLKSIGNRGQAVVEYVLVLIVLLVVFMALMQFNREFRKWGEEYFVEYYRCLLETGEIPGVGANNGTDGLCAAGYEPFSFRAELQGAGGPGDGGGGTGGGGGPGGTGNGGGDTGTSGSDKSTSEEGSSGSQRGTEASRVGSSSGSGSGFDNRSGFKPVTGREGSESKKKKSIYTGSTEVTSFGARGTERSVTQTQSRMDYGWGVTRRTEERGEERSVASVKTEVSKTEDKKKMKVQRDEVKKQEVAEDEGFTLGNFIRFLIIAAIIIALLVLIGGQLLQISKSAEAEG
jgi:hypothetical protein